MLKVYSNQNVKKIVLLTSLIFVSTVFISLLYYEFLYNHYWIYHFPFVLLFVYVGVLTVFSLFVEYYKLIVIFFCSVFLSIFLFSPDYVVLNQLRVSTDPSLSDFEAGKIVRWGGGGFLGSEYWFYLLKPGSESSQSFSELIEASEYGYLNNQECDADFSPINSEYVLIGSSC